MATAIDPNSKTSPIGRDTIRIDGPLKVTGAAQYTSDFFFPGMLYAVPIEATIANGKIARLDTAEAEKMPGVRAILHRRNIGKFYHSVRRPDFLGLCDERRPPLADDLIRYYGQYVGLAVADTLETAKAAADAVHVDYAVATPNVSSDLRADDEPTVDSQRGDPDRALADAPIRLDETYITPVETHNPMELHATTAVWEGSQLTLYESTQSVNNSQDVIAQVLGLPRDQVRVVSKFLGSGFGGKLWPWTHCYLAAEAARQLQRPVKLVISRKMMFQSVGHRPRTVQRVRIGASPEGKLLALQHDIVQHLAMLDDYKEDCGEATPLQYRAPNLRVTYATARRNVGSPTSMRGPGRVPGLYATESALNELAFQLKIDPIEVRLRNEPKIDEAENIPFSSRHLVECFKVGAEKFGWSKRDPAIGSMKRDGLTLGWGMAGASWTATRFSANANVDLRDDGSARVACCTQDIGTGTYTILAQITADKTGVPVKNVEVALGDSRLPKGPISGGSMATASVAPAIIQAADNAIAELLNVAAKTPGLPFGKRKAEDLAFEEGCVFAKAEGAACRISFADLLKRADLRMVSADGRSAANFSMDKQQKSNYSLNSFGAHFVEITWQSEIARLRVSRVVTVMDAGRIINTLAGRNQIEGGIVMGIGMALMEQTSYDARSGAPINSNYADYIVPANADVSGLEVHFLDYPDKKANPLGARGIGEIGLVGVAAAITDAVHHATGVRVRELPVKIEDLLQ
jgi:xanthine dehydrogenase YagR molybdenum-binding subunit